MSPEPVWSNPLTDMNPSGEVSVSVVVTHWRRKQRLFELIDHLLGWLPHVPGGGVELLIVDSASVESAEVAVCLAGIQARLAQEQPGFPFRFSLLPENGGPSKARQHGLQLAKGHYIQYLDDDDWIKPEKIPNQFLWASANHFPDVVASRWAIAPATAAIGTTVSERLQEPDFSAPALLTVLEVFTHLSACLLKRQALLDVQAFAEGYWLVEDVHLQLKLIAAGASLAVAPSQDPLFFYRSSPTDRSLSSATDRSPFVQACLRNVEFAEGVLQASDGVAQADRPRLASLYGQHLSSLHDHDPERFRSVWRHVYDLDARWLPNAPMLRRISRLVGYPLAEQLRASLARIRHR